MAGRFDPGLDALRIEPPMTEHQSRYLSNNGRLFFNSADALVAQDQARTREENVKGKTLKVGVENVYEYEPRGSAAVSRPVAVWR